jgi:hypothetical protein
VPGLLLTRIRTKPMELLKNLTYDEVYQILKQIKPEIARELWYWQDTERELDDVNAHYIAAIKSVNNETDRNHLLNQFTAYLYLWKNTKHINSVGYGHLALI